MAVRLRFSHYPRDDQYSDEIPLALRPAVVAGRALLFGIQGIAQIMAFSAVRTDAGVSPPAVENSPVRRGSARPSAVICQSPPSRQAIGHRSPRALETASERARVRATERTVI